MYLKIVLILIVFDIVLTENTCTSAQGWTVTQAETVIYPVQPLYKATDYPFKINDISSDTGTLKLSNIRVDPNIYSPVVIEDKTDTSARASSDLVIIIDFDVLDAKDVFLYSGVTYIGNGQLNVDFSADSPIIWKASKYSITLDLYVARLEFSQYSNDYLEIKKTLNSGNSVSQQILTVMNGQSYLDNVNTKIQEYYNRFYLHDYTYVYKNTQGVNQTINFKHTGTNPTMNNLILNVQHEIYIDQYDNICATNLTQPNLIVDGKQRSQIQTISTSLIETIVRYAEDNKYFDFVLDNKWRTDYFQFNLATLQHLFTGLSGQAPFTPVTGFCNLNLATQREKLIFYNTDNDVNFNYTTNYQCQLQSQIGSTEKFVALVTAKIKLTVSLNSLIGYLNVSPQNYEILQLNVMSQDPTYTFKNPNLAKIYFDRFLQTHVINKLVFGSGFQTSIMPGMLDKVLTKVVDNEILVYTEN